MIITCVSKAVIVESYGPINKKEKSENESSNSNLNAMPALIHNNQNNKQYGDGKRERNEDQGRQIWCHTSECLRSSNKCFACGETSHIKKNYPNAKEDNALVPNKLNAF